LKAKYHDPHNESVRFNERLNRTLLRIYYQGLFEFVRIGGLPVDMGEVENRECHFVRLTGPGTPYPIVIAGHLAMCLALETRFAVMSTQEGETVFPEFPSTSVENDLAFLDTDGVGVALRSLDEARRPDAPQRPTARIDDR